MPNRIADIAHRLAENAEAVCRHYLSSGRRHGSYWLVGDVHNTPGKSLYVRLHGPPAGRGAAGKWTDAATGEHGDLLDLIGLAQGAQTTADALDEAQRFLGLLGAKPQPSSPAYAGIPSASASGTFGRSAPAGSQEAARRLFAMSKPIGGTLAESYLRARGILGSGDAPALRFHPHCFYRAEPGASDTKREKWPALVAAVTGLDGEITGLQRTWLDPDGQDKAPISTSRRAMGHLLGHAVRFDTVRDVMAAGEGIETVLSLRSSLPSLPMGAALSAGHLAALLPPPGLRRLYILRDNDPAGHWATNKLVARMQEAGIEALVLASTLGDWNDDLRQLGPGAVAVAVRGQLAPEDVTRFWRSPAPKRRTL